MSATEGRALSVVLLRGINVGGKNKIAMSSLRELCGAAGLSPVVTYITSGNIVCGDAKHRSSAALALLIEERIRARFALSIPVLVRTFADMQAINSALPDEWVNDKEMKSDILFLWRDIDSPAVVAECHPTSVDHVRYVPGALLWSVARSEQLQSGLMRLAGRALYQKMTVRNVTTFRALYALITDRARQKI